VGRRGALVAALVGAACLAAEGVDRTLGAFEVVAVPATLVWLAYVAADRTGRHRPRLAWAAALAVGCTVAQPFGAVATPITSGEVVADASGCVSPRAWHSLSIGPLPVVAFQLYERPHFGDVEDAGDPSSWIRVRTWLGPLTNGSDALGTEDDSGRTLQLCRSRSGGWLVQDEFYGHTDAEIENGNPLAAHYVAARLGFGVASASGVAYWLAVGALLALSAARVLPPAVSRARRPSRPGCGSTRT
jgi:hypothetical protein